VEPLQGSEPGQRGQVAAELFAPVEVERLERGEGRGNSPSTFRERNTCRLCCQLLYACPYFLSICA
jgi:hypothetical protein